MQAAGVLWPGLQVAKTIKDRKASRKNSRKNSIWRGCERSGAVQGRQGIIFLSPSSGQDIHYFKIPCRWLELLISFPTNISDGTVCAHTHAEMS